MHSAIVMIQADLEQDVGDQRIPLGQGEQFLASLGQGEKKYEVICEEALPVFIR